MYWLPYCLAIWLNELAISMKIDRGNVCVYHATLGFVFYWPYEMKNCLVERNRTVSNSGFEIIYNTYILYPGCWNSFYSLKSHVTEDIYRIIKIRLVKQKNTRGVNDVLFRRPEMLYIHVFSTFLFLGASVVLNIMFLFLPN